MEKVISSWKRLASRHNEMVEKKKKVIYFEKRWTFDVDPGLTAWPVHSTTICTWLQCRQSHLCDQSIYIAHLRCRNCMRMSILEHTMQRAICFIFTWTPFSPSIKYSFTVINAKRKIMIVRLSNHIARRFT